MAGNFPPDYFAPDYFAPDYFGGEVDGNAMSATIAGVATVTADLTAADATASQPVTEGGNGRLWNVYQQEVLRHLAKPKSKRAERRKKARQKPLEASPAERPLEALATDLKAEQQRLDVVVATLADTQARIAEADERERVRRKRNNEAALLLLAA